MAAEAYTRNLSRRHFMNASARTALAAGVLTLIPTGDDDPTTPGGAAAPRPKAQNDNTPRGRMFVLADDGTFTSEIDWAAPVRLAA